MKQTEMFARHSLGTGRCRRSGLQEALNAWQVKDSRLNTRRVPVVLTEAMPNDAMRKLTMRTKPHDHAISATISIRQEVLIVHGRRDGLDGLNILCGCLLAYPRPSAV